LAHEFLATGDTEDRETVNLPELGLIVADVSSTRIIGDSKPTTAKPLPELSSLATIAEKQLKGNALSHQSMYVRTYSFSPVLTQLPD